jgi:hypothetical protein
MLILTAPRISPLKALLDLRLVARPVSYTSAMGRRIQRVHRMAAKREQDVMPTFYQYEFRDLDLLESVSAAGFTCVHVHSTLGCGRLPC